MTFATVYSLHRNTYPFFSFFFVSNPRGTSTASYDFFALYTGSPVSSRTYLFNTPFLCYALSASNWASPCVFNTATPSAPLPSQRPQTYYG